MKRILSTTLIIVMLLVGPHIQAGRAQSTEEPISTVNGQAISIKEYQDRARFTRWQFAEGLRLVYNDQGVTDFLMQWAEDLADTDSWDDMILDQMEDDILVEQAAPEFGIAIDEAAVQAQFDRYLRMQDESLPDNREALDAAAAAYFAEVAAEAHVTQEVVLRVVYSDVLRQALMAEFIQTVPTEELQVHCRQIQLAYNPDALVRANEILTALEAGGDFGALARAESDDRDSAANSGDLGWASPNVYAPEFAEAVTNAPIGEVIGPIETQYGYHIIQVLEREMRPVPDEELSMRRLHALPEWLDEQRAAATIERREDWADFTPDDPTYDELLGDILPLDNSEQAQDLLEPITTVNGQVITIQDYQARVRYIRWLTADQIRSIYNSGTIPANQLVVFAYQLNDVEGMGALTLDEMEEEILMEQAVAEQGIVITDAMVQDQIDQYVEQFEGLASPETPEARAALDAATEAFFTRAMEGAGVEEDAIRSVFYADALRKVMVEVISADAPSEVLQVHCREILLAFTPDTPAYLLSTPTDEERAEALARANNVLAALQAGEDFAELARIESDAPGSASNGGDLGWQSPYEYLPEIANPLRDEPIGAIIGPIETRVGYRFFQVLEREVRPLPEEDVVGVAFNMWLAEQKAAATIERREDWADFTPDDPSYDELLGDILPLNSRSAW